MTSDLRRRLALLLVGAAAMLVALLVRQRLLLNPDTSPLRAALLGALVGVLVAVFLWRTFTYFANRRGDGRR